MKRIIEIIIAALILLPIPLKGERGLYNTFTGMIWCMDEISCMHEMGHLIDQQAGWASKDVEYIAAVQTYVMVELYDDNKELNPAAAAIMKMMGKPTKEIYAEIFALFKGDVPASLKKYYPQQPQKIYTIPAPKGLIIYAICDSCYR